MKAPRRMEIRLRWMTTRNLPSALGRSRNRYWTLLIRLHGATERLLASSLSKLSSEMFTKDHSAARFASWSKRVSCSKLKIVTSLKRTHFVQVAFEHLGRLSDLAAF